MLSIANEVNPSFFLLRVFCMRYKPCFSNNWYQSGLQFRICITCFVSFGIRDSNFMMLEDSTINFLHGCWNYCRIKIDIDVMMLFKFDIKYVRLNFKTIASMEFNFDLNLILMWSRNHVLFKWNVKNGYQKNLKIFNFMSFDRSRIPSNQLNAPFDRSNRNWESIKLSWDFVAWSGTKRDK